MTRTTEAVRVVSATPGRARYEVRAIRDDATRAAALEVALLNSDVIRSVSASALTGRVLILFPPERDYAEMTGLVEQALSQLHRFMTGTDAPPRPKERTWPLWGRRAATTAEVRQAHPIRSLLNYRPQYASRVRNATTLTVFNKALDLAPPLLIALAIEVAGGGATLGLFAGGPMIGLVALAALTAVIWIGESFFEYRYTVEWENFAHRLQDDIRLDVYNHVQVAEMAYLEGTTTGNIIKVVNSDVNVIEQFFREGIAHMIGVGINLVIATAAFLFIAPSLAWATLLPVPVILWYSLNYERKLGPKLDAVREKAGTLNAVLVNDMAGMATIRSFTAEDIESRRLGRLSDEYLQAADAATRLTASFTPIVRMAVLAGFMATLLMGGSLVIGGTLSPALFAFMLLLTQRILWPLTALGHSIDNYERTVVAARRIFRMLEAPVGPKGGGVPLPVELVRGEVQFERVTFGYRAEHPVLQDLSIRFPPGETTAIVGVTGSGKSTIVKLLLYFYETDSGRITLDDHDIRHLQTHDLRRAIGLVSQDVFLFDGTVYENIEYGRPGASPEEVIAAAHLAEAHAFIEKLPDGYQTRVGERGMSLSGGQRQRVSLARAFLKDPPILILDEATSSVDNETEAAIQRSLQRLAAGRTTIAIAHRLSTVRHAHRIHVLGEQGRIIEQGTHEELLERNGYYARLWDIQTGRVLVADEVDEAPP